jgi:hypothetical protein
MTKSREVVKFKVNGTAWGKFKLRNGDKMKLYIKLNKEETEQWSVLRDALTGGSVSDDNLARMMFFRGVAAFTNELNERIEGMSEDEKAKIIADSQAEAQEGELSDAESGNTSD